MTIVVVFDVLVKSALVAHGDEVATDGVPAAGDATARRPRAPFIRIG